MDEKSKQMALAYLKQQKNKPVEQQVLPDVSKYSISADNLRTILKELNGRCPLCGKKQYLVLDHNHKTKKARGYICRGCNNRLAGLDDEKFMTAATEYLKNPPLEQFYT